MTAMLSCSVVAAALPQALSRSSQKAGRAAEFIGQFFQKGVKPFLADGLPAAGLLRQEYLHEVEGPRS